MKADKKELFEKIPVTQAVLALPVFEVVNKCMFSDRVITPVDLYVSGLGWGEKYIDIAE